MSPLLSLSCFAWVAAIVLVYFYVLAPELAFRPLADMLPVFWGEIPPSLARFAGLSAALAAATGAALLSGRLTGRALAAFLRLGRMGDLQSIPLGWIAAAFIYLGLGLAGLWHPGLLAGAALILTLSNLPGRWKTLRVPPGLLRSPAVVFPALLAGWALLLMSLAPEVFQDPLRYHLFIPEQFLRAHKCFFMPDFFFWSYFGPVHALYSGALAVGGRLAAQAVNLAAAFLCVAAVVRIAAAIRLPLADQRLALGLMLSAPGLLLITGSTFAEHGHALYALLALEWILGSGAPCRRARAALLLAGQAFAVKYTAAFGIAGLAAALAVLPDRARLARALRRPAVLALAAAAFLPWGLWRWLHTLDPVSPTLGGLGLPTMDHSSAGALARYYDFIRDSWLASPGKLLGFPLDFAGAHASYWECAGPAIPALMLAAVLAVRALPAVQRAPALFCFGSFGAWLLFFGGTSPHYVAGYYGIWTAGCLAGVAAFPGRIAIWIRRLLAAVIFFQALVGLTGAQYLREPRNVAFGIESEPQYLNRMLLPAGVAYPLRDWLNRRIDPGRDRVLVYGDDNGSYFDCRVHLDLERAHNLLLWRLAEESRDAGTIRKRLRQRGFTWMFYSLHWSVLLAEDETSGTPDISPRALNTLQDFWRIWAEPVIGAYPQPGSRSSPAWAVRFRDEPNDAPAVLDRWKHPELLPGTLPWLWLGVERERERDLDGALAAYRDVLERYPDYAMVRFQVARICYEEGKLREARRQLDEARKLGWILKGSEAWFKR